MGIFPIILIIFGGIVLGQIVYSITKGGKLFFILHLVLLLICVIIGVIISENQTGGVSFPWWLNAIPYSIPVIVSLFVGLIRKLIKIS